MILAPISGLLFPARWYYPALSGERDTPHRKDARMTGEMDLRLEALSKYIVTSPSWAKSLALIVVLSGCVELMAMLGSGKSLIHPTLFPVAAYLLPALAALALTPGLARWFSGKLTYRVVGTHRGHRPCHLAFRLPFANPAVSLLVSGILCSLACLRLRVPDAPSCRSRRLSPPAGRGPGTPPLRDCGRRGSAIPWSPVRAAFNPPPYQASPSASFFSLS